MATGRIGEGNTAIQPTIVDAKGDLIAATAADTPARLAVGSDGETLVADSSTTTGLAYIPTFFAGKNKIINGDFGINQRNFTSTTTTSTYGFDRWQNSTGGTDGTCTFSAQTFTPGTAPVAGYEGSNYFQLLTSGQTATDVFSHFAQNIENVRTFAGQTVTVSFWAKAATGTPSVAIRMQQNFGSGGSTAVSVWSSAIPITTSWARYSRTFSLASISGKTIGTNSLLATLISVSSGSTSYGGLNPISIQNNTFQFWGVQVEAGSTATAFQTATGSIQGELAACQRYYWNISGNNQYVGIGYNQSTTEMNVGIVNPVAMRTTPTLTVATGTDYYGFKRNGADDNFNSLSSTASFASVTGQMLFNSTEISGTAGQAGTVRTNNASAKIEFSAEL